jgi:hypothetical protein
MVVLADKDGRAGKKLGLVWGCGEGEEVNPVAMK